MELFESHIVFNPSTNEDITGLLVTSGLLLKDLFLSFSTSSLNQHSEYSCIKYELDDYETSFVIKNCIVANETEITEGEKIDKIFLKIE
jgi:hypothetical protein